MKLNRKTKLDSEIPTASMPDIIFMLLIFFMVTTVLREYSGLPISLPKAKRIEKLKSKRHTSHIWVSKEGLVSIEDKLYSSDGVRHVMYEKRISNPQLVVSLKADEKSKMVRFLNKYNLGTWVEMSHFFGNMGGSECHIFWGTSNFFKSHVL